MRGMRSGLYNASSEGQRVSSVLYWLMLGLYDNHGELNSATRRRHALEGHLNGWASRLYGAHWTRNAVRFDLNTRAIDLNAFGCVLYSLAFALYRLAFALYSLAPRRCSLQVMLAR